MIPIIGGLFLVIGGVARIRWLSGRLSLFLNTMGMSGVTLINENVHTKKLCFTLTAQVNGHTLRSNFPMVAGQARSVVVKISNTKVLHL